MQPPYDRLIGPEKLMKAKQGFYQNDERKGLGEPDFMEAVGVTATEYRSYLQNNPLIVSSLTHRKMLILASPSARHFKALFKILDIQTEDT